MKKEKDMNEKKQVRYFRLIDRIAFLDYTLWVYRFPKDYRFRKWTDKYNELFVEALELLSFEMDSLDKTFAKIRKDIHVRKQYYA